MGIFDEALPAAAVSLDGNIYFLCVSSFYKFVFLVFGFCESGE